MENDVLRNKIAPWQEKGRWYKITAESNGSVWTVVKNETDERLRESTIGSGYYIVLADNNLSAYNHYVVDAKFIPDSAFSSNYNVGSSGLNIYYTATNQDIRLVPATGYTGKIIIFIFIFEG